MTTLKSPCKSTKDLSFNPKINHKVISSTLFLPFDKISQNSNFHFSFGFIDESKRKKKIVMNFQYLRICSDLYLWQTTKHVRMIVLYVTLMEIASK
jgi:hypothetical protein